MNLNKGCIEIMQEYHLPIVIFAMNLNKGCIEIYIVQVHHTLQYLMNLNKGCIEIRHDKIKSNYCLR